MTGEKMLALATRLREAAHYCTELSALEDQCRDVADELERVADVPQSPPQEARQIADAKRIAAAVLKAISDGADSLEIYEAVYAAVSDSSQLGKSQ
jgi:hypothetical protein